MEVQSETTGCPVSRNLARAGRLTRGRGCTHTCPPQLGSSQKPGVHCQGPRTQSHASTLEDPGKEVPFPSLREGKRPGFKVREVPTGSHMVGKETAKPALGNGSGTGRATDLQTGPPGGRSRGRRTQALVLSCEHSSHCMRRWLVSEPLPLPSLSEGPVEGLAGSRSTAEPRRAWASASAAPVPRRTSAPEPQTLCTCLQPRGRLPPGPGPSG